jgi:ribosome biogenesis GTPase
MTKTDIVLANPGLSSLGWSAHFMMQIEADELETLAPARLTQIHRSLIAAITPGGSVTVTTRTDDSTGDFAVGDWVLIDQAGQVQRRLDRVSLLERRVAGGEAKRQLIGANVDVLFITSSCNKDFNIARLERYLILARDAGIQPALVLTKADLAPDPRAYEGQAAKLDPMLPVITLDARRPDQVGGLYDWWRPGQTAAMLGSSGVGKTTLLNTVSNADHDTGGVREDDAKGRHTTTARGLYSVGEGRWLLDTPGMRELRLFDVAEGVEAVFSDIVDLAAACRFSDCGHDSEPGCAVTEAIGAGALDPDRLKRWQKLEREDKYNSETIAEAHQRAREFGKRARAGKKAMERKGKV